MASSPKNETQISFFRSMRGKLILLFLAVALIPLGIAGTVALIQFNRAEAAIEEVGHHYLPRIIHLHEVETAMWHIIEAQKDYIITSDESAKTDIGQEIEEKQQTLTGTLDEFEATLETEPEIEAFQRLQTSLYAFLEVNDQVLLLSQANDNEAAQALSASEGRERLEEVAALIADIEEINEAGTEEAEDTAHDAAQNGIMVMLGVMVVAAVVVVVVALLVANSLAKPLVAVAEVAQKLALGDVSQTLHIKKRDEIGLVVAAFNQMIDYQQQMAAAAGRLAQGDVTADISPQSDKDVLGHAFSQMIDYIQGIAEDASRLAQGDLTGDITPPAQQDVLGNAFYQMVMNLRHLIGQVIETANTVGIASDQLATTAEQAGQATQQVATTIQQVAQGTTQQTQLVIQASANVGQMAQAAEGIARGAQEQAQGVQKTSHLMTEMATLVKQVGQGVHSVTTSSARVTQAAHQGVSTVEQTGQGMAAIRTSASLAADKVREMGTRSREIGRIIETIDDIADKTDMLALNAAVEAARAGEQGRGFAVVAEQVRKLSEDSKGATRDITNLIERVQTTIQEAIVAIEDTTTEVNHGSRLTGDTTRALQEILLVAEEAASRTQDIGEAASHLQQKSEGLVAAMEAVSVVVEENTAVAEEMASGSQQVMEAINSVAGVAEENSASAEEVNASAEEMSAQVEEMVSASQDLSSMAEQLRLAVAQFQIEEALPLKREEQGVRAPSAYRWPQPTPAHPSRRGNGR